ncbi:hypothetical protein [Chamaesiphon sp. VAR_69_metabat_338]|uniref:hypothetical protein n=1 Tax=Chamaesiphon sp. VAR_69_metabat_338 TaxID=2964704 RepID=UPI00286DD684|nr:hypothetical protein [Chamaesiphon sp. VAR_69_metabat_338]
MVCYGVSAKRRLLFETLRERQRVASARNDCWLQRTLSQAGSRQATIQDRLFALLSPQRHHFILDLNFSTGLITWEALHQVPEGGVYTSLPRQAEAIACYFAYLTKLKLALGIAQIFQQ